MAASIPLFADATPPNPLVRAGRALRMVSRATALFAWTFLFLVVRLGLRPLRWWAPPGVDWRLREGIQKCWGRGALRIMGIRVTVIGTEPRDPYFLVSNHLSYIDIVVYSGWVRCIFVAMKEMRGWPLIGYTVAQMQTIFIDRLKPRDAVRVNHEIQERLTEGKSVIMFPEATTGTGDSVLPFRGAILDGPLQCNMPVHYATIQYHRTPGCPNPAQTIAWVDDTPFDDHIGAILRVRRLHATIRFAPEPVQATTRKELALRLEEAVRDQLLGSAEDTRRSEAAA